MKAASCARTEGKMGGHIKIVKSQEIRTGRCGRVYLASKNAENSTNSWEKRCYVIRKKKKKAVAVNDEDDPTLHLQHFTA